MSQIDRSLPVVCFGVAGADRGAVVGAGGGAAGQRRVAREVREGRRALHAGAGQQLAGQRRHRERLVGHHVGADEGERRRHAGLIERADLDGELLAGGGFGHQVGRGLLGAAERCRRRRSFLAPLLILMVMSLAGQRCGRDDGDRAGAGGDGERDRRRAGRGACTSPLERAAARGRLASAGRCCACRRLLRVPAARVSTASRRSRTSPVDGVDEGRGRGGAAAGDVLDGGLPHQAGAAVGGGQRAQPGPLDLGETLGRRPG